MARNAATLATVLIASMRGRLLRLSLFQVSVGASIVLLNGTLNRVMIVELGVATLLVSLMVSLPLVFAPLRVLIGFKSDNHRSVLGWRRVPYIWMGTLLQFGGFAIMPFALLVLSGEVIRPFAWVMSFGIITGTFSSVYIASPLLMIIEHRWPGEDARGEQRKTAHQIEESERTPDKRGRSRVAHHRGKQALAEAHVQAPQHRTDQHEQRSLCRGQREIVAHALPHRRRDHRAVDAGYLHFAQHVVGGDRLGLVRPALCRVDNRRPRPFG